MKTQSFFYHRYIFCILFVIPVFFIFIEGYRLRPNNFVFAGPNDLNQNNDANSAFDNSPDSYFPSNPLELMNVLRSLDAMSDSTPPSDAIDDALREFEMEGEADSSSEAYIR